MNLHIFFDTLGYYLGETFDRIERIQPGNNYYINLSENTKYKRVKVLYTNFNETAIIEYINSLAGIKRVYFHYYTYFGAFILKKLKADNPKIIAVWVFWSGDFYNLPKFLPTIYLDYSKRFFLNKPSYLQTVRDKLFNLKAAARNRVFFNHRAFINSFNLFDYFATILKQDYDNVVKYSESNMRYTTFAYLSYEQMIDLSLKSDVATGNEIMIGHSADPTLNHYEVLETLKDKNLRNTIYLPIAYGDETYKQNLSKLIKVWFKNTKVQTDFIDKEKYNKNLLEVGYAVFNSRIQQALGNLIVLLWYGVKIFLREENSVYQEFKKWNLLVYSVQTDLPSESFEVKLSTEQIEHNRNILKQKLSSEMVDKYYSQLLNIS